MIRSVSIVFLLIGNWDICELFHSKCDCRLNSRYELLLLQFIALCNWVGMQLLGTDSHDIDIAIDDMLGKEFCKKVNEYLESIGEETQGVGIIQR